MQYLLMIYNNEAGMAAAPAEGVQKMNAAYMAYTEAMNKAGVVRGGNRLRPTAEATTVRVKDGKNQVLDGPYADTKEQLAGDLLPNAGLEQKIASGYNKLLMTTEEGGSQAREYMAKYAADRVRNVSALYALHCDRGAEILAELEPKPWGVSQYAVRDLDGGVAVAVGGTDLGHDARPGLDDGHRHQPASLVPDLGHTELRAQDAGTA